MGEGGRTYWLMLDAAWLGRENVVILGERCGPFGIAVMVELLCEAKAQNDSGRVKTGYRAIAHKIHTTDAEAVRSAVHYAAEVGLLDDFEEGASGRPFTARISGWAEDQKRGHQQGRNDARPERGAALDADSEVCSSVSERVGDTLLSSTSTSTSSEVEVEVEDHAREDDFELDDGDGIMPSLAELLCIELAHALHQLDASQPWVLKAETQTWRRDMADLIAKHGEARIREVLAWVFEGGGSWWRAQILSPAKLRQHWTKLSAGVAADANPVKKSRPRRGQSDKAQTHDADLAKWNHAIQSEQEVQRRVLDA